MDDRTRAIIVSAFEASSQGRIHFGDMIGQLMQARVESYHVDYRAGRATCYLPDGDTLDVGVELPPRGIADTFDAEALRAAIRGAQQGQLMYPQFKQLSQAAGCCSYTVWIAGRHVTYAGRHGDTHVERFPD
ncbi:hypothetical protein ATSB10_14780 [Dyella thiooxydans]|uniref:DUF1398 domain-containing protein n=1 Tax=Dyella thiooxydans TaxID=445710 RepID=A0A160N1C0_9GAMM|nr:DUF1398 family protein [Dyella thiooxydans]AND68932.1 hypothetical protein ATSB10_14780 [Dyella thiooxydans]